MGGIGGLWQAIKRKLNSRKISNNLVTLSSAAILAVYAAGYERTRPAADRFTAEAAYRRTAAPAAAIAAVPTAPLSAFEVAPAGPASPARGIVAGAPPSAKVVPDAATATTENLTVPVLPAPEAVPAAAPLALVPEQRTVEPPPALPAPPPVGQNQYKDGSYEGWGTSRHGDIQANVVIQDGRIASAAISQCLTRYPCSWIAQLPGQVVSRQNPTVDYVSGATQSVDAYYYAVVEALSKAK